jgi:very-long-chain enoyl-CoA reductase
MEVESLIPITLSYFTSSVFIIYAQHQAQGLPEPEIDLKYPGIALFVVGISGNFYHHRLLSKLRSKNDKEYKVPKGGLFDLVICPHYLFEILGFLGISLIAQTLYAFSFFVGTTLYLMGRSYVTRRWYLSQFKDFPKDVKALIPSAF